MLEREADHEVGVAAETADADLFAAQLFRAGNAATRYQDVGQNIGNPRDDLEPRASHIRVQERRAAGLKQIEAFPDQRLRRKRTARDENQFQSETMFAEDAGVLSDVERRGAVKAVEADMQSGRLSRRGLRAKAPESENQNSMAGDPFHTRPPHRT